MLDTPLKLRFKYCFQPVNLADTENLLLPPETLDFVAVVVFQTLFLAASTGVATENKNISPKTTTMAFHFIKNIITLIMQFKKILIIVLVLLVGGIIVFFVLKPKPKKISESPVISLSPTPISVTLTTWNDEAGFSFQYPEGITIDKHADDTVNYANLTFTDGDQDGSIDIVMSDNDNTLDKWTNAIDTVLGEKDGKKNMTNTGMMIGVVDDEVLITLKRTTKLSPLLEAAWQNITDTWKFVYPTPKVVQQTQTAIEVDGGDVLEEE